MDIIDFHAHILPCADHGSDSLETSLWQLQSAQNFGVSRIIATPHFYPHRHTMETFLERRHNAYMTLKEHIPAGMEVKLGAEAFICPNFENLPGIENLFIEGTRTLLLELPFTEFHEYFCDTVRALRKDGIEVIMAHADRYSRDSVEKMIDAGAKIQLNAPSLLGIFKRKDVYSWIDRNLVVALGSDVHMRDQKAYRNFQSAIQKIGTSAEFIKQESDFIWNK